MSRTPQTSCKMQNMCRETQIQSAGLMRPTGACARPSWPSTQNNSPGTAARVSTQEGQRGKKTRASMYSATALPVAACSPDKSLFSTSAAQLVPNGQTAKTSTCSNCCNAQTAVKGPAHRPSRPCGQGTLMGIQHALRRLSHHPERTRRAPSAHLPGTAW